MLLGGLPLLSQCMVVVQLKVEISLTIHGPMLFGVETLSIHVLVYVRFSPMIRKFELEAHPGFHEEV
jgi:hypothetical protein